MGNAAVLVNKVIKSLSIDWIIRTGLTAEIIKLQGDKHFVITRYFTWQPAVQSGYCIK